MTAARWRPGAPAVAATLALAGALVAGYWANLVGLVGQWNRDPNYSYGFFVAPMAAAIYWSRRGLLDPGRLRPRWWGFLPLVALLAVRPALVEWNEQYVEAATLPMAVAAAALAVGGVHPVRVAWPALAFLFFMLPLPPSLNSLLAQPLQRLATAGSLAALQVLGMPVLSEGNVIIVGSTPMEVARACNGLSMLLSFVTLITATVILVRRPWFERALLLASAVPIAVACNVVRITATALCSYYFHGVGGEIAHEWAGYAMMPMALGMVWLELRLWSWLFVEVEMIDAASVLRRNRAAGMAGGR